MTRKLCLTLIGLVALGSAGCKKQPGAGGGAATGGGATTGGGAAPSGEQKDDWVFTGSESGGRRRSAAAPRAPAPAMARARVGLAVGGAKDVGNFRENIKNDYLPLPTDLTYEGLFYDYFFDTGPEKACDKLFCPTYARAVSKDPLSGEPNHFLSVGLTSGMKEGDFARKKLNLVVVLDISGSMGAPFNSYYYDRFGNKREVEEAKGTGSKMQVANESLVALVDRLKDDDRLGVVLFDDQAYLAKPLSPLGQVDVDRLKQHIRELRPAGGTNMAAGIRRGAQLLEQVAGKDPERYESRIIFLTDAMPNVGETGEGGLLGIADRNAEHKIYTTFIGIGVDFNTALVERITKLRGANYYAVHSAKEFRKRLAEEFDYMVTPLVFDLTLKLEAPGWEIAKVYGSPEADQATGEVMRVNTLFPSKVEDGETRGGVVLLRLRKKPGSDGGALTLKTSYHDRGGKVDGQAATISFPAGATERHDNGGVRKAVVLARYADLLLGWILDLRRQGAGEGSVSLKRGIRPPGLDILRGKWERKSMPLRVPAQLAPVLKRFREHFAGEAQALKDDRLKKELALLDLLVAKAR